MDAVGYDQITEAGVTVGQFSSGGAAANDLTFDEGTMDDVASDISGCGDVLDELLPARA